MAPPDQQVPTGFCRCGCGERTELADRNEYRRGWRKGEPKPYLRGHNTQRRPLAERLWAKVAKGAPDECWEWQGGTNGHTYPFYVEAQARRKPRKSAE